MVWKQSHGLRAVLHRAGDTDSWCKNPQHAQHRISPNRYGIHGTNLKPETGKCSAMKHALWGRLSALWFQVSAVMHNATTP